MKISEPEETNLLPSIAEDQIRNQYDALTCSLANMKQKGTNEFFDENSERCADTNSDDCLISDSETSVERPKRIRFIMCSLYLGVFLSALDNTVISTLLPHIASELNELPRISWVATAYLFSCAIFQPLFGKISDVFGRKYLIMWSTLVFFLGCLICGTSKNVLSLVFGRFVTGIGGGGINSLSSIIISDIIPLRNRAVYQGSANFFYALGTAAGGVLGGFFTEHLGGWRSAFLIQLPFCFLSFNLLAFFLRLEKRELEKSSFKTKLKRLDFLGIITLLVFLLIFMTASTIGFSSSPVIVVLLCALLFSSGGIFAYIELKVATDPILPISFLTKRNIIGSGLANWFCMMGMMTTNFYLPIYLSSVSNMGPIEIGKRSIPSFFSLALGSFGTGYYLKRYGKYFKLLMVACVVLVLGQLQINLVKPDSPVWSQYCLFILPAIGMAVMITVTLLAMTAAVPQEDQAAVTSIGYAFRSTGCTLGVSIGAAVFQNSLTKNLASRVMVYLSEGYSKKELSDIIDKASRSSEWSNECSPKFVRQTLLKSYDSACHSTFKFCFLCFVLATLSCSIIKEYPLHSSIKKHQRS